MLCLSNAILLIKPTDKLAWCINETVHRNNWYHRFSETSILPSQLCLSVFQFEWSKSFRWIRKTPTLIIWSVLPLLTVGWLIWPSTICPLLITYNRTRFSSGATENQQFSQSQCFRVTPPLIILMRAWYNTGSPLSGFIFTKQIICIQIDWICYTI